MALKLRDHITTMLTYVYHDVMENSFIETASTHRKCELRTNDTGRLYIIQSRNKQVAKETTVFVALCRAFINSIRILETPSKQIDIILATKLAAE
jgi:hypothetical protein